MGDLFDNKVETGNNSWNDTSNQANVNFSKDSADNKVMQDLGIRYAKALEKAGMNVENPIIANAIYYNKSGFNMSDPPQAAKTYVFITRPDCNFARANLRSVPYFDMMFDLPLGKMLFPMLTHPHRYINHEYAQDDFPKQQSLFEEFWKLAKDAKNAYNGAGSDVEGDISGVSEYDLYTPELKAKMNEYRSLWEDNTEGSIETQQNEWGNQKEYDFRMNKPPVMTNLSSTFIQAANVMPIRYNSQMILNGNRNYYDTVPYTSPFIPLLMNNCLEVSAGKDYIISSKETEGDYYGGRQSYPTGGGEMFASGEISLNFRDNYYGMVYNLMWIWITYIDLVSRGEIFPRIDNIWEKILDYTCSIYVFVCDKDFSTLKGWAKYTGCRPTSITTSGIIHSAKGDINSNWEQFSVPFVYNHVEYMTPEIFTDFNYVAGTEYHRKLKRNFNGYSLFNSRQSRYSATDMFDNVTEDGSSGITLGVSGQSPEKILKVNSEGQLTNESMSKEEELANLNATMPGQQRVTFNDHWDGFPIISSNRLVWIHRVRHKVASTIKNAIDETYDEAFEELLESRTSENIRQADLEAQEEAMKTSS